MRTIQNPIETVGKIAGVQACRPEVGCRSSAYSLEMDCPEGRLLYHTLTGEMVLLEPGEGPDSPEVREHLVRRWFLVPQGFDELRHCEQVRNVERLMHRGKKGISHYVIFTTTDCNARCYYCFEKGQRRYAMTEQTARDVAAYMVDHAGGERISIRWFGGEPLYNAGVIDVISRALRNAGVDYMGTMVSNAYLFDPEMIRRAKELWNLRHVLVTIDGTEQVYNRTKAFIYGGGSAYRRVLSNIDSLLGAGIAVTVNLNMDAHNAQDLFSLADELGRRYGGRKGFDARVGLLIEYVSKIPAFDSPQAALDTVQALNQRLASHDIHERKRLRTSLMINACMADDPSSAVILPDGRIGRCEHFGDSEEVGSIYEGVDEVKTAAWREVYPAEERCRTCTAYPQCNRLKKCNATPDWCNELIQGQRLMDLRDRMRNTYEKWKADQAKETGGN